jgi:peptide/nickel transport system ATP-binding protein
LTIADQIAEPLEIHNLGDRASRRQRVAHLLTDVGLSAAVGERYPHQLSGGQRQRAVLARALATNPDLLVCDEPVSALDVSIQAQVVNMLQEIQARTGLTMLFISHDLRIVRHVSQRLIVLYLGQIIEMGDAETLFAGPRHPYTRALASAVPDPRRPARDRLLLAGEPPDPSARPRGCVFHPRCPLVVSTCRSVAPVLQPLGPDHAVACHRPDEGLTPRNEGARR